MIEQKIDMGVMMGGGDRKRRESELRKILKWTGINPKILKDKE